MDWSNTSTSRFEQSWPGHDESALRIRGSASGAVKKLLRWAAALVLLRLAVLPWLILFYNYHRTPLIQNEPMVISSVGLFFVFLICSALSKTWPMFAVLIAGGMFGWWCYYDFNRCDTLIEAGIIGKSVLGTLILWAFMQAVMSRTM